MTTWRHLTHLLRGRWFRRLFRVRVTSQFADGIFQIALASYVIFSPERQPSPVGIATALAVVLLPFSVLGPFVGVFLDRWSRRQVLAWSNAVRVVLVCLIALSVAADVGAPIYVLILASLSVNRFLLAGLSASLPHVVDPPDLIMANSVTPTAGTLASLTGVAVGSGERVLFESSPGFDVDIVVLLTAATVYGLAALLALRIPRDLLGPAYDASRPAVREAARHVARGLSDGLTHLSHRRPAADALAAIGAQRFFFGMSTVMLILLYRNYFNEPAQVDAAFNGLALAILVSGAGFVSAAFVTPFVTERVTLRVWIVSLLLLAAFTQLVPGALFTERALLVSAYFLGLASQGIKICVDTLVQAGIDDAFRGRVFSLYDVIFNVAFVAAAAVAALVLPLEGRSYAVVVVIALGYLATAALYGRASRQHAAAATLRRVNRPDAA